jgi:hypothetical protein
MKVLLNSDVALWSPPEEPKMGCTIGGALRVGAWNTHCILFDKKAF